MCCSIYGTSSIEGSIQIHNYVYHWNRVHSVIYYLARIRISFDSTRSNRLRLRQLRFITTRRHESASPSSATHVHTKYIYAYLLRCRVRVRQLLHRVDKQWSTNERADNFHRKRNWAPVIENVRRRFFHVTHGRHHISVPAALLLHLSERSRRCCW